MNVLLSIKPKYVKGIMNGNKRYEFRRSIFRCREDIELVYIYSTSPVKKIVGVFTIKSIDIIDLNRVNPKFKTIIRKSGVNIYDRGNRTA